MNSKKRIRSVCHSIAHHAVSALSYLHPHLKRASINAGLKTVFIDLLSEEILIEFKNELSLIRAIQELRKKFESICNSENLKINEIEKAALVFSFPQDSNLDYYCTNCFSIIKPMNEPIISRFVDHFGNEINKGKKKYKTEIEEMIYEKFLKRINEN